MPTPVVTSRWKSATYAEPPSRSPGTLSVSCAHCAGWWPVGLPGRGPALRGASRTGQLAVLATGDQQRTGEATQHFAPVLRLLMLYLMNTAAQNRSVMPQIRPTMAGSFRFVSLRYLSVKRRPNSWSAPGVRAARMEVWRNAVSAGVSAVIEVRSRANPATRPAGRRTTSYAINPPRKIRLSRTEMGQHPGRRGQWGPGARPG